jgi:hypothetical protein
MHTHAIELTDDEITVLAVLLHTAVPAPAMIEQIMENIAYKILLATNPEMVAEILGEML